MLPSNPIPGRQFVLTRLARTPPVLLPVFPDCEGSFRPEMSSFRLRRPFAEGMENHRAADREASHSSKNQRLHH